jgi:hypothetical protein
VHAAHPFLAVWDDHDVEDNYADGQRSSHQQNPELYDFVHRGYGVAEFSPTETVCDLKMVDAKTPGASSPTTIARFRAPLGARIPEQIG